MWFMIFAPYFYKLLRLSVAATFNDNFLASADADGTGREPLPHEEPASQLNQNWLFVFHLFLRIPSSLWLFLEGDTM